MLLLTVKKIFILIFASSVTFIVSSETDNAECPLDKPDWPKSSANKGLIVNWLLNTSYCRNSDVEYPSYDGWYHNMGKIDLGSVEQPLLREWPAFRMDDSQSQNWSKAWNEIISQTSACKMTGNALLLFFAKQVIDEILNTKIPTCIDCGDSNLHNSEQLNYASPYIDGEVIYGRNRYMIKTHVSKDGTIHINRLFDIKTNKEDGDYLNTSDVLRIIWLRWHNHIAKQISEKCQQWPAQKVFNEARKWTIAVQQRIYAYEWLPLWIDHELESYSRYDLTVDPQIENLFQAAMAIPQFLGDIKTPLPYNTLKKNISWNDIAIDKLIKNLTVVPCKTNNISDVQDVQQQYNGPDINSARKALNLTPYPNWTTFLIENSFTNSMLFSALSHKNLQHLDAMLGGTLESKLGAGKIFSTVINNQFRRIRDGDRFWFENLQNKLFSCEEVVKIGQITFADILLTVTNIDVEFAENKSAFNLEGFHTMSTDPLSIRGTTNTFKKSSDTSFFLEIYFYIATFIFIGCICIGIYGIAVCLIVRKQMKIRTVVEKEYNTVKQALQDHSQKQYPLFPVKEYVGVKSALRQVVILLKKDTQQIAVQSFSGLVVRVIDLKISSKIVLKIINLSDEPTSIIQLPHHYDLVLKFESDYLRTVFTIELDSFIASNTMLEKELITSFNWKSVKSLIVTKEHRQEWLEMFFRVAFAQAFKIHHSRREMLQVDAFVAKEVIYTELTIFEFADALSMNPDSEFVKRMFTLTDKDKNGFISFREFIDLIILFAEGNEERKAKLLFDLYDINCTGLIPAKDFLVMIKSFLETIGGRVYEVDINKTINAMLRSAGVGGKRDLDFNDFKSIIGDDINNLSCAKLGFKIPSQEATQSHLALAKRTIESMYQKRDDFETRFQSFTRAVDHKQAEIIRAPVQQSRLYTILLFLESYSKQVFLIVFLTSVVMLVFAEGVYYSNLENKLSGINWYIFGLTRGAKHVMVFTYALLFITTCKNVWAKLRDLLPNKYFPFDFLVQIHIYVSLLSVIFTAIHVVGEILIFYEIILTSEDLACLLKKYIVNQETFNIYLMFWQNYVVITGFILFLLISIVYVFALPYIRQKLYDFFYITHQNLYPVIIIVMIMHGSQSPTPLAFSIMSGPLILFFFDLFVSFRRRKIELPVLRAEYFPSNVICLILRRPKNFQYKVGQWIRLAIPQISRQNFHSVSLSSAPHEPFLRIHLRPTTSWACQVHSLFEGPGSGYAAAPVRAVLDGPYGSGAQHWRTYDVVVLVGAGTGVASFAAMLKDVSYALHTQKYLHCQKVYFIWVAKTQRHFEWIVDLIRETEHNDPKHYLSCHIFITQFYEKFDLRTIMLYICEKNYQRISGKSLFTNLRAVTHFGRPSFPEFFMTVHSLHPTAKHIGVFSSGPASLTGSVDEACRHINLQCDQRFEHHSNDTY